MFLYSWEQQLFRTQSRYHHQPNVQTAQTKNGVSYFTKRQIIPSIPITYPSQSPFAFMKQFDSTHISMGQKPTQKTQQPYPGKMQVSTNANNEYSQRTKPKPKPKPKIFHKKIS